MTSPTKVNLKAKLILFLSRGVPGERSFPLAAFTVIMRSRSIVKNYCRNQRDSGWHKFFAADKKKKDLVPQTSTRRATFYLRRKNKKEIM